MLRNYLWPCAQELTLVGSRDHMGSQRLTTYKVHIIPTILLLWHNNFFIHTHYPLYYCYSPIIFIQNTELNNIFYAEHCFILIFHNLVLKLLSFILCFCLYIVLVILRGYSWLCTKKLLPAVLRRLFGMLGFWPCKANTQSTVLSLQPLLYPHWSLFNFVCLFCFVWRISGGA